MAIAAAALSVAATEGIRFIIVLAQWLEEKLEQKRQERREAEREREERREAERQLEIAR